MKMVRKLMMVLVAAALVLPAAGFAEVKAADGTKPAAVTRQKPVIAAPADCVVTGKTSKQIARALGTSHRTVEIHRRRLMEKMHASTLADLVRMHLQLRGNEPDA